MVYMGSKAKYAHYIVPILQQTIDENKVNTYIECFVGGANIIDKIQCENRIGYDRSDTLIALLNQMSTDFSVISPEGSREMWDKGKGYVKDGIMPADISLADIGAIEFFGSFSNRGFPGGYAKNTDRRNYYNEAYRNAAAQAPNLAGITFACQNYWELDPNIKGAVIYLDPPYQGTKHYGYASQPEMNYDHFWDWVRKISVDNYVFISEQSAPADFDIIWQHDARRTNGLDNNYQAVEKLFKYNKGM